MVIVLLGVSGSGKTTVGRALAARLGWEFYDADDFHPRENIERMRQGRPLDDASRRPWLERLRDLIGSVTARGGHAVLACSALKRSYRNLLCEGQADHVRFVYLQGSFELIAGRLEARTDHFFDADLLTSQFETLEEPTAALTVSIVDPPECLVEKIIAGLALTPAGE